MSGYYEQLSDSARIQRIAQILSKGVALKLVNDRKAQEADQDAVKEFAKAHDLLSSGKALSDILDYIVKCGASLDGKKVRGINCLGGASHQSFSLRSNHGKQVTVVTCDWQAN